MPRGIGRGYRGFRRGYPLGGFFGIIDLIFLLAILYVLFKLFTVAAVYVVAPVLLLVLWRLLRPRGAPWWP